MTHLQSMRIFSKGGWEDLIIVLSSLKKFFLTTFKILSEKPAAGEPLHTQLGEWEDRQSI